MEFKRKKKRGLNQKTRRLWFSAEGYQIIWRKEVCGVNVKPAFQAYVQTVVPGCYEGGCAEMWDFVEHNKRLYRTMGAAVAACEHHHKLWDQARECTGVRAIQELFGRRPTSIPKWVVTKLDKRVSAVLLDQTEPDKGPGEEPKKKAKRK